MTLPGLHELLDLPSSDALFQMKNLHRWPLQQLATKVLEQQQLQHKEHQLKFYQPVSEAARKIHESNARRLGVFGWVMEAAWKDPSWRQGDVRKS